MKHILNLLFATSLMILSSCGDKKEDFDASGTFEADEITVSSESNGRILSLNISEGQNIEAGYLSGEIDSVQIFLKKKQLINSIKAIESRRPEIKKQIAVIEQQISTQKKERSRIEQLLQANVANKKQLDDINASIYLLEKQLEAQRSTLSITSNGITEEVSTMMVQIEQLEDQLKKCKITNPIKGTVLVKYANAGELAVQGKAIYKIADISNITLKAYITSNQLTQIKIGQEVKVFADYGDDYREYKGKVTWISSKAEFTPKTIQTRDERANLVYAIKVMVKNDDFLKIGMYGQIKI